jgi:MFS family permease
MIGTTNQMEKNMNNKKVHYAWWIMVSCMAMMFGCTGILVGAQGIFFRSVVEGLRIKASEFSFYLTIGHFARAFSMPFAGKLLNTYDNRPLISLAIIFQAGAFICMGLYETIFGFYISAVIMGIAASITQTMSVPVLINNWFEKKAGTVMGITMSFSGIGAAIMQYVGAVVINQYGWKTAYFILGLIAITMTLPFALFVIRTKPSEKNLLPYGAENSLNTTKNIFKSLNPDEQKNEENIHDNSLFYIMVIFAVAVGYISSFQAHISNFASSIGVDIVKTGLVASVASVTLIAGKFSMGFINDRLGLRMTTLIYSLFGVVAAIIKIIFTASVLKNPYTISISIAFCSGILFAVPTTLTPIITRALFGSKIYSLVYSKIVMFYSLSMAFGSTINGIIYDIFESYFPILIIIGIMSVITIFLVYIATNKTNIRRDIYNRCEQ